MQEKDLGFNKEDLICINMGDNIKSKYYIIKNKLQNEPLIKCVTASDQPPTSFTCFSTGASWDGKDPKNEKKIIYNSIDYDYVKTMKMEIILGRDFSKEYSSDFVNDTIGNFLVNEEILKYMGIKNPVGKNFNFQGISGKIVGVLKNFNFQDAKKEIQPMVFFLTKPNQYYLNFLLVKLSSDNVQASIKTVERVWKQIFPDYPLEYTYVDQDYNNLYKTEIRISKLLKYFTIIAIIIACMGLYGLASYSAVRRTKEIGIRKVMGAGSFSVIYSLSKEFLGLILISIVIAIPLGWYAVSRFLEQFAYRIDINIFVFIGVAVSAIVIAILTVCFQAYKASNTNPAEALNVE